MSDEDIFEDSDDGDFSASEDEWAPGKEDDTSESDFEETINDSAELESTTVQKAKMYEISVFYCFLLLIITIA